ncbi:hypothetical protein NDU88_001060 [Pleurodeles waltl]|uniref:Uncharacterized protein n=1 Tax=Pleurodeles waltl TaxID=8319 RepID=A0AAV7LWJ4_PLEWA|nr:hypothetical protein NDU88_001060 [Pleurodeles waltl]
MAGPQPSCCSQLPVKRRTVEKGLKLQKETWKGKRGYTFVLIYEVKQLRRSYTRTTEIAVSVRLLSNVPKYTFECVDRVQPKRTA